MVELAENITFKESDMPSREQLEEMKLKGRELAGVFNGVKQHFRFPNPQEKFQEIYKWSKSNDRLGVAGEQELKKFFSSFNTLFEDINKRGAFMDPKERTHTIEDKTDAALVNQKWSQALYKVNTLDQDHPARKGFKKLYGFSNALLETDPSNPVNKKMSEFITGVRSHTAGMISLEQAGFNVYSPEVGNREETKKMDVMANVDFFGVSPDGKKIVCVDSSSKTWEAPNKLNTRPQITPFTPEATKHGFKGYLIDKLKQSGRSDVDFATVDIEYVKIEMPTHEGLVDSLGMPGEKVLETVKSYFDKK